MSRMGSFIKGAFWGGVISSALVLLFTPYTGEELKANVMGYIDNVRDEVQRAGTEKRMELEAQLEDLRSGKA